MTTWDEAKRRSNLAKHGVDFAAVSRFDWSNAIIEEDDSEAYGEQRQRATGLLGPLLHVYIYTLREDDEDHAISLRPATKSEKRKYIWDVEATYRF